jgi:putative transposase
MKKSRFSEEQIIAVLKEHQAGVAVVDTCRKHRISDVPLAIGAVAMVARRLKAFDDENRKLKKLLAESMLDVATLREALGKNS